MTSLHLPKKIPLHHPKYLFFIVILITGAFLRLILLPNMEWFGDPARDILVAQHILRYGEIPNIGHVASGTNPIFYYPPLYFYILAILQIPSTNIWYIGSTMVLFNVLSIVVIFFLTKRLSDTLSAFIATTFYTYSPYILQNQSSITAYRFDLPIFLLGTYLHITGIQKKQPIVLFLSLFFLAIASSINYAVLILMPIFILWIIIYFHKHIDLILSILLYTYTLFIIIFYGFAKHTITLYGWTSFIAPFLPTNYIQIVDPIHTFINHCILFLTNVFPEQAFVSLILILFLLCINIIWKRQRIVSLLYPLSFIMITIVLSALKKQPVMSYFYYSVTPFLFILLGMCSTVKKPYGATIISGIIILFLGWYALSPGDISIQPNLSYQKTEYAVDAIIAEIKKIKIQEQYPDILFWRLRVIDIYTNEWQMSAYAYFLEKKLGRLLKINDHYHNLAWIGTTDYLVIVCQADENTTTSWCHKHIIAEYPQAILIKQIITPLQYPVFLYRTKQ